MRKRADDIRAKIKAEEKVLKDLNGTQCTLLRRCQLFINTSSITIRGVYEIDGELLIQPGGEEIAVFSFDQIDLGPEVNVTVVGQRPLILASRSTARFQTPFVVAPGTLGGFPGGYSVGSDPADVLRDDPRDVPLGDPQILDGTIASTNANGPGAPSVRVHLRSVRTEASDVDEIQRVTLAGDAGERGAARTGGGGGSRAGESGNDPVDCGRRNHRAADGVAVARDSGAWAPRGPSLGSEA